MKWFGRKAGRDESRPVLARGSGGTALGEWPRTYDAQVRDGYCLNAVAQRAVKLVAEGVASAPIEASHPEIEALVRARSGGRPFLEGVAAQMLLHGNAFLAVMRDGEGGVDGLFALRSERVRVELDAGGWPAAYRYQVGERVTRFSADPVRPEVIHLRSFNPVDDHYGLGCLPAAAGAVAIHDAAARWHKALLDNAARPPMLLGLPGDSRHANYREANRALWRLSVLPMAGAVLSGIAEGLRGWWDDARLVVDLDRVPALAEERAMLWRSVTAADWLSDDEKRALVRP